MRRVARWRVRAVTVEPPSPQWSSANAAPASVGSPIAHGSTRDANASKTSVTATAPCRRAPRGRPPRIRGAVLGVEPAARASRHATRLDLRRAARPPAPRRRRRRRARRKAAAHLACGGDDAGLAAQRDDEEDDGLEQQDQVARRHRALHPREGERGDRRRHAAGEQRAVPHVVSHRLPRAWSQREEEEQVRERERQRPRDPAASPRAQRAAACAHARAAPPWP